MESDDVPEDQPTAWTRLAPDLKTIWMKSPLEFDQARRIIAAAGLPTVDVVPSALEGVLAAIAIDLLVCRDWYPRLTAKHKKDVAIAFKALVGACLRAHMTQDPPPEFPDEWKAEMGAWGKRVQPLAPKRGPPEKVFDSRLYPLLLGFFEVAFDKPATRTAGGAAMRFMTAFFTEMSEMMRRARLIEPLPGIGTPPDISKLFEVPEPEALQSRIRKFAPSARRETIAAVLQAICAEAAPASR